MVGGRGGDRGFLQGQTTEGASSENRGQVLRGSSHCDCDCRYKPSCQGESTLDPSTTFIAPRSSTIAVAPDPSHAPFVIQRARRRPAPAPARSIRHVSSARFTTNPTLEWNSTWRPYSNRFIHVFRSQSPFSATRRGNVRPDHARNPEVGTSLCSFFPSVEWPTELWSTSSANHFFCRTQKSLSSGTRPRS